MKKKKLKGYILSKDQILLLKNIKKDKKYKKVLPTYKGMVTYSINKKKIVNSKHLSGVKEAIKTVNNKILERFDCPTLNIRSEIKFKIKPFNEIYIKDDSLPKQENHKKYLKSGVWKRKRIFILKKRGCKCENCGYKPKQESELHIHHRTYRKWGAEYQNHLKIMCKDCHNKLHDKYTVTELEDLFLAGKNPKV